MKVTIKLDDERKTGMLYQDGVLASQIKWRSRPDGTQEVWLVVTHVPYRRRGYATALLRSAEVLTRALGVDALTPMGERWWRGIGRDPDLAVPQVWAKPLATSKTHRLHAFERGRSACGRWTLNESPEPAPEVPERLRCRACVRAVESRRRRP